MPTTTCPFVPGDPLGTAWANWVANLVSEGSGDDDMYHFGALTFRDVPDMQGVPRAPGYKTRQRAVERLATRLDVRGMRSLVVEEFGSATGRAHCHHLVRVPASLWELHLPYVLEEWQQYHGFTSSSEVGDFDAVARYCAKYLTKQEGRMWLDGNLI